MNLLNFGTNSKELSIIKDPFIKGKVTKISVTYGDFWRDGKWKATGFVDFKNGNTEGCQNFEAPTFDEVVQQMKTMINNL